MGNDLHCSSAVIAPALFVEHRPVYFAGSHIGIVVQAFVDKPLVVTQVQIRLCPVVGHKNFAVLNRVHCARIHIQVRIKFLHSHFISARLKKPSQRRRSDPLSQAGDNASCHKYIFGHLSLHFKALIQILFLRAYARHFCKTLFPERFSPSS